MKRKLFISILLIGLSTLSLTTLTSSLCLPDHTNYRFEPCQWWDETALNGQGDWVNFYDIKFSVYQICHDGYGFFNEGPFYAYVNQVSNFPSQWVLEFTGSTYATVWVKYRSTSSWSEYGSLSMSQYNVQFWQGMMTQFTIDMGWIAVPVPEE